MYRICTTYQLNNYKPRVYIYYYGNSRPERYYRDHIYDRRKDKTCRFDTLSLLVNILNPYHTLFRYYSKGTMEEINELEKLIKKQEKAIGNLKGEDKTKEE